MLVVWQRRLCCSGQRINLRYQQHHRGPIIEKLERYQLVGNREDVALFLELKPSRRLDKTESPHHKLIGKK